MNTVTYAPTAYRPDRIPAQLPSSERSWLKKMGRVRLPWGNTQELAPAKFFYQDTPADLRFGEEVRREDAEKKANGTYKPRITETEDFHYIHDHQRHRFAQLSVGGRFWTNLYIFGKGITLFVIPVYILVCIMLAFDSEIGFLAEMIDSIVSGAYIFSPLYLSWMLGALVVNKLPKLWIRPSRGPLWELNRQTGMVTVFDYDNNGEYKKNGTIGELTAPFHEFDAYVISSPDRQGLPLNVLNLSHRYRDIRINFAPLVHQSDDVNEHFALWDYIQNYMDVSRPLPDVPYLEQYRQLDPTTAEHDRRTGRNPRYWVDMDDETFKTRLNEIHAAIRNIDTLRRPNLMAKHCEYVD
ncbi:hypothetical protein SAMN05216578_101294 [Halopseudomonas formosensis]|uniref:Transmembrane protein n=1 Tax=Halopseudomonas formosensis TaxID=1002526 RepID=A0A1I5ZSG5_9GAMM|nr:hypothetical protein [Halopseudomonas formosensis]SFQ59416.1 hypothetical protein SAMN05216578_101294 [Halopseudomonas formosensis]